MEQAYRAMFYFLEQEYERTGADEIGGLLGSLSWKTFLGRGPADPGAWVDWEQAVNAALSIPDDASPSWNRVPGAVNGYIPTTYDNVPLQALVANRPSRSPSLVPGRLAVPEIPLRTQRRNVCGQGVC